MMNRSKFLYELKNIERNIEKLNLVLRDLSNMAEDDTLWDKQTPDSFAAAVQLCDLVEEARLDMNAMCNCNEALHEHVEESFVKAGYKREHGSYGKWVKADGQD